VTAARVRVFSGAYRDSLMLLSASRRMRDGAGVRWASALMATPGGVAELAEAGFPAADLGDAGANDLVLAARADDQAAADAALERGWSALFGEQEPGEPAGSPGQEAPRTVADAAARLPGANVAVVSVPGPFAALAAHQALSAGLDVLLFSDNVPVAEEVELKERAEGLGRLVMGPGAGTAVLGGTGLGFANAVRRGRVGVVAAAGTGAQEVMTLLDRWGVGISHVVGVGGRDLSAAVGGRMTRAALRALDADPGTDAVLLVSKPPDLSVAAEVVGACRSKPLIGACIGLSAPGGRIAGVPMAPTLEAGAVMVARRLGHPVPDLSRGLRAAAASAAARLADRRTAVRGLFTGGTLCYEAQVILGDLVGPVHSNAPLRPGLGLPAPGHAHVCLDLGEEEFTRGRPHPMIDPAARLDVLRGQAGEEDVAVVLLDVVLGYGSHPDPAGQIAGACAELADAGVAVVGYVLGTRADPQGWDAQRATLREAGVVVTDTAARAARTAAAIALRQPDLAAGGHG